MKVKFLQILICSIIGQYCLAQDVPILNYSVNAFGQVQLEIEGSADQYYLLTAKHQPNLNYESITSMTLGSDGNMIISEPLASFPFDNYSISAHSIDDPADSDGDGIDDITEFNNMPFNSPFNYANQIPFEDGTSAINTSEIFSDLGVVNDDIPWAPFLNNQEFVKFAIVNQGSDEPEVYFINSKTHYIHADFLNTINVDQFNDDVVTGEIVYNPNTLLPNGSIGSYSFNYSFGDAFSFELTRRTFELLAVNMPFLSNNFIHYIGDVGENDHVNNFQTDFEGSRIMVALESQLFEDVEYIPFNQAEGYGFFRHMDLDENPGSRDVVLYDALPNSLPRVGGIITSVLQTPLSHVNLRAIQDNLPNAFINNPLEIDSIANLLDKYVYYKVESDRYIIREATLDEVNAWYEKLRPTVPQIPERDLSQTSILPLDDIDFDMSIAFGAKCTNVATMRKFGFPEGTIPNGFGIPFYYYDEFMKFNDFYTQAEEMLNDPDFISDLETRIDMLKDFRKEIKDADMPQWMLDDLQAMHDSFPEGTAVRCRSSTNNEDLPGFSGAGLYTSKTQHLDEGHISKSIKQVYASMWNFRAYDEREFYRVDQYIAAMGVLCHPNYQDEKSNGVGVSIDPIYETENTFYLNTQVGESLITNPEANSIPEEILLNQDPDEGYFVLRSSNLVPFGELVMAEEYLDQMRSYLSVIHDEFEILYNVVGAEGFGMDIEYKVTKDDQLIIKQARPWVSFWSEINATFDLAVTEISEPQSSSSLGDAELVTAKISNQGLRELNDFEITLMLEDQVIETLQIDQVLSPFSAREYQFNIPQDFSEIGDYNLTTIVHHPSDGFTANDTLLTTIQNLHVLEGGIVAELHKVNCGFELEAKATVTNYGESTFNTTEIEVISNGEIVDTIEYTSDIPFEAEQSIFITINENLQLDDNEIILNLLTVNDQPDAVLENNSSSFNSNLDSNNDFVTLLINTDDYGEETSWELFDQNSNELIAFNSLSEDNVIETEDICVDYNSCFTLYVYDTYGDGICCDYGIGYFQVINAEGDTIIFNDGDFGGEAEESFCPSEAGCVLSAQVISNNATTEESNDGSITINTTEGVGPFEYSIDGGDSYVSENEFINLPVGEYLIVVNDGSQSCIYEETVNIGFDMISSIDDINSTLLSIYPNPTSGQFTIEVPENFNTSEYLNVDIYNSLGKLVKKDKLSTFNGKIKANISIQSFMSGRYFVRCHNEKIDHQFKLIKL